MKDMLKSKGIIAFIVIMLGMSYINACCLEKQNASAENTDKINYIQK